MPEIFEIANRYTVFRNGEFIAEGAIKDHSLMDGVVRNKLSKGFYLAPRRRQRSKNSLHKLAAAAALQTGKSNIFQNIRYQPGSCQSIKGPRKKDMKNIRSF